MFPVEIENLITEVQTTLVARQVTVATAESCTGGLLATFLTDRSGSSAVYLGGVSAYANAAKSALLGVDAALIEGLGAVSGPVAEAMARGIQARLGATYALSLTGVAGPGGGSLAKPVGTVYCGVAGPGRLRSVLWQLGGDRSGVRLEAARRALLELLREVRG